MIRNNIYDALAHNADAAKAYLNTCQSLLIKAEENGGTVTMLNEAKEATTGLRNTCKTVYTLFLQLKADYDNCVITQARYKHLLTPLKELLTEGDEKVMVAELNAPEIAAELKKFFN